MKLGSLNQSIRELPGVGPKAQEAYKALGIQTIADLITFSPKGYEDRSKRVCIGRQIDSQMMTNTIVKCVGKSLFGKGLKSVKAIVEDTENGVRGELLGFNRPFLDRMLYQGSYYHLYANAMPSDGRGRIQFSQFEIQYVEDQFLQNEDMYVNAGILPCYSLAAGLTQKIIRRDIKNALARVDYIDNKLPQYILDKYKLLDYDTALRKMHMPHSDEDIIQSRRTLAFTEVFYLQLTSMRKPVKNARRRVDPKIYNIEKSFIESLNFELTPDQVKVLEEIRKDMSTGEGMNRLLQGDVGSGKTLVAWISALHAIAEGSQVAFMAPTELLARQHAMGAARLLENTGIRIAFLNGEVHGKSRDLLLTELKKGNIDLLIGTHALFSKDVEFKNLGYVIVDEQHRFGVEQRNALFAKGENPDILLMTATPIPRTLALTIYGNLNVSTIKTMPIGRLPVKTYLVGPDSREKMYRAIGVELERGHQAYFVYPRIEASEDEDERKSLRDVETMYDYLANKEYSNFKGALIHSKIDEELKIKILEDFANHKLDFLVSTSVVEVGIDVPNATCMAVEHAETFGLSALHQLRGRVGRSTLQSWCFLTYETNITEDGKKRLSVLHRTNDGFEIAEEDLKIRGPGEITGLKQSGFINLRYASLDKDISMMACAREEVAKLLQEDAGLIKAENAIIREELC